MSPFKFNPNDLQRLNRLVFTARAHASGATGNRRSRNAGEGIDFLDFRPYTPGDDVRRVDWGLYGRLRQLFVRLNESPRQLSVTLLIDTSQSMLFGSPVTKLEQAQRVACALGFVAMRGGERVFVYSFADQLSRGIGPLAGARGLTPLVRFLQNIEPGGSSDLAHAMTNLRTTGRHRGLIVVLSDFMNVTDRDRSLGAVVPGGGTVLAVQILDPIDRGEGISGNLRLRDSESGSLVDVKVSRDTLERYRRAFDADRHAFEGRLTGPGRHYLSAWTTDHYLELVCRALRKGGVLR